MADTLTIRVDETVKKKAKLILNDLGLDLSSAINIYLKKIIKEGGIPFMIREPSDDLKEALEELDEMKKHPENYKFYSDVDEMFSDLDKQIQDEENSSNK